MRHFLIFILLVLGSNFKSYAQDYYTEKWENVEKLEVVNRVEDARKIVRDIYKHAKRKKNDDQLVKTFLFRAKFNLIKEEKGQQLVLAELSELIDRAKFPKKNVYHTIYAKLLNDYVSQNRWKLQRRTAGATVDKNDFDTWDIKKFYEVISTHHKLALKDKEALGKLPVSEFAAVLNARPLGRELRPTLLDLLAREALDFYKTGYYGITRPKETYVITDKNAFSSTNVLREIKRPKGDTVFSKYDVLQLYAALETLHENKNEDGAYVTILLERLDYDKSFLNAYKELPVYKSIHEQLLATYKGKAVSTIVMYNLAQYHYEQSNYKEKGTRQADRDLAIAISKKAIEQFPDSYGAIKCSSLLSSIYAPSLRVQHQDQVIPNELHRGVIQYKNVNEATIHYIKVAHDFLSLKGNRDSLYRVTLKTAQKENRVALSKTIKLESAQDTYDHSYQYNVDGLDAATYLVVIETKSDNSQDIAASLMTVSQMSILNKRTGNTIAVQVLDKKTGKPLKNVKLELSQLNSNYTTTAITDRDGKAVLENSNGKNSRYTLKAVLGDDIVVNQLYSYFNRLNTKSDKNKEVVEEIEVTVKSFTYLDRSIYRPGQTVYYKSILLANDGKTSFVVPNEEFVLTVYDANNEEIQEITATTNEYGSFHGEFTLPKETLTGQFYIEIDSDEDSDFWDNVYDFNDDYDNETKFQVEEYKRPRFKVDFKKVKESYAMNDSVVVTAFAKALLGSNITDADVHYKVTRSARLPWWRYSGYYSGDQVIVDSDDLETDEEFVTNNKGEYAIKFKAIADSTLVAKDLHPIYTYRIDAEVVDINGETRTASTSVRVGKQSIEVSLLNATTLSTDDNKVKVAVKNLNGELVEAQVELQIRQLKTPDHVIIPSALPAAEFYQSDDKTYRDKFPYAELRKSEKPTDYKTAPIIFKKRLTIDSLTTVELPITKNWDNGNYVVYVKAVETGKSKSLDNERDYVEEINKIEIWANKQLPVNPAIISHDLQIKDNVATVNYFTSMDGVYMNLITYDFKGLKKDEIIFLPKGKTTKKYKLKNADKNLLKFRYSVQKENKYTSNNFTAQGSQKAATVFNIETNTFRNKLYPGMEEEWSFTIKDQKGNGMNGEVLASMYDKSLDEFTVKNWDGFSFNTYESGYEPGFYRQVNCLNTRSASLYFPYRQVQMPQLDFDQFNYFGLSFTGNMNQYNNYKARIEVKYEKVEPINGFITGRVMDSDGAILGATITIKGTELSISSDFDGLYKIKASPEDTLVFTYAGYETIERVVGNQKVISPVFSARLDAVVVTAYRTTREAMSSVSSTTLTSEDIIDRPNAAIIQRLEGQVAGLSVQTGTGQPGANALIQLRGASSINGNTELLIIVDGVPVDEDFFKSLDASQIKETAILKGVNATALYGNRAANGIIIISTKAGVSANDLVLQEMSLNNVQIRKDLKETAFFLPNLKTDKKGNLKFSFTSPEMLTQWKLRLFAHNKKAETAYLEKLVVTQKELSLIPNAPRFLRETDTIRFSTKIANLSDAKMEGIATLQLFDALTMQPIDQEFKNTNALQNFSAEKGANASVNWTFVIPVGTQAVTYRVIAKSDKFSDGEENTLPVLTNRMLVTESRSLWVRAGQTEEVVMDKLENNTSTTLENHQMTFEYTSNPSWYAIKSLPYLMEYEHECAEQTFSRYYANAMAAHILNSSPKVKEVFDSWAANGASKSKLEQNEELKSVILAHTPWLRDAQSEEQKQQRLAVLFDLDKTAREKKKTLAKLEEKQGDSGGFPWFSGGNTNEYITRHIAAGIGHLNKLGVNDADRPQTDRMYKNAIAATDRAWVQRFNDYLRYSKSLKKYNFGSSYWHYQYARSFEPSVLDRKMEQVLEDGKKLAFAKAEKEFASQPLYTQLLMAIALHRNGESKIASKILEGLRQTAVVNNENRMYWKENTNSWYWYRSDVETQALAIEAFSEIQNDTKTVEELQVWLLKKKRTTQWKSTKATAVATYALLLQNGKWTDVEVNNKITWAGKPLPEDKLSKTNVEAGTGYFKITLDKEEITKKHARVEVKNKSEVTGYGGLYWQYFEDLDKITTDTQGALSVKKILYKKVTNNSGKELKEITSQDALEIGDLITVRLEIKSANDMDFIHLKDMRASGFEPVDVVSKYKWQDGLGYYQSTKDVATHFFFDHLKKGTYVFEYDLRANNAGNFSNGITTIENMYAPEFSAHNAGERVVIKE
ncbi:MG2 domain-containing protein [uncultured Nonlabens sp.]|uniref:alpha-2-macroglobulin family protein n=1 Tax=uncultured Nonlabens sp. TaxID=859306 RepID=UPI0026088A99|nr:MG2 domain-containing protein [uncultured Nonlabens sp.]